MKRVKFMNKNVMVILSVPVSIYLGQFCKQCQSKPYCSCFSFWLLLFLTLVPVLFCTSFPLLRKVIPVGQKGSSTWEERMRGCLLLPEARDFTQRTSGSLRHSPCLQTLLSPRAYDVLHVWWLLRVLKSLKFFLEVLWPQGLAGQMHAKGLGDFLSVWKEEIIRSEF